MKVDLGGSAHLIAGSNCGGTPSGEGGQAPSAVIGHPIAIVADTVGNVFVADNYGVRRVDGASGVLTTLATFSSPSPTNLGGGVVVDTYGNIYFIDYNASLVRKIDGNGATSVYAGGGNSTQVGGLATGFTLNQPATLALDAANNLIYCRQRFVPGF